MKRLSRYVLLAGFWLGLWVTGATAAPPVRLPVVELPPGLERARDVQRRFEGGFFAREGVVGVGIGENAAGRPVLRVLVSRAGIGGIPRSAEGIEVESQVTGRFIAGELAAQSTPSSPRESWPRPVPIGVSIGHTDVTAGTLGCQVFRGDSCHTDYFILSNNHVLANTNMGLVYDLILQPGPFDGGVTPDSGVAYLSDWEAIDFSPNASNLMDAAIAITGTAWVGNATPPDGYGRPRLTKLNPSVNLAVKKYGRTSRLTTGRISMVNLTARVDYSSGTAQFVGQILVAGDNNAPFSQGGDSGSLVVAHGGTNDRRPVGLLFAGAGNLSLASPIGPILSRFGVNMVGE